MFLRPILLLKADCAKGKEKKGRWRGLSLKSRIRISWITDYHSSSANLQAILLENFFPCITSADIAGWQETYSVKTERRIEWSLAQQCVVLAHNPAAVGKISIETGKGVLAVGRFFNDFVVNFKFAHGLREKAVKNFDRENADTDYP